MKKGIYGTLALSGIQKNKKLYYPYLFTCIGTIMMCYIISFLSQSPVLADIRGGKTTQELLGMGFGVMCVFAVVFLFYTNSFLIRRRKKEFGLYNILGLGKKHLTCVLFLETLIIASVSILCGLLFGILFSKLAELCMVKVIGGTATFTFYVGVGSIVRTVILFCATFGLIFLNVMCQVRLSNPIQLLRSENVGEKPPKANWLFAVFGALLLSAAYYLAVSVEEPLTALVLFMVAVIMVIIGTYCLFIAGSVTLCRVLQKWKGFYYKTNRFVAVSSMAYRMKRNGAGLASICILSTMVLVMVSSTVCLFVGTEDSLLNRYPRNIVLELSVSDMGALTEEIEDEVYRIADRIVQEHGLEQKNILQYRTAYFAAYVQGNQIIYDESRADVRVDSTSDIWQVFLVPVSDYNRLTGASETLESSEVIMYTTRNAEYAHDTIQLDGGEALTIVKQVDEFVANGVSAIQMIPSMYLFVPDVEAVMVPYEAYVQELGMEGRMGIYDWFYGFDLSATDEEEIAVWQQFAQDVRQRDWTEDDVYFTTFTECMAEGRADFYGLYSGLFFLGILLGIVFIFATVLIIYYKQISEGYEDRSGFAIMQKVGMTKPEIKKSINAQVMIVFFLPLLTAGVHLAFAFPMIARLLTLFNLTNVALLVITTACCFAVFTCFYMVVYRMTSRSYFSIVSGMRE